MTELAFRCATACESMRKSIRDDNPSVFCGGVPVTRRGYVGRRGLFFECDQLHTLGFVIFGGYMDGISVRDHHLFGFILVDVVANSCSGGRGEGC